MTTDQPTREITTMTDTTADAAVTAHTATERAVDQVLHAMGPDAVTRQAVDGFTSLTRTVPADWRTGIRAVRLVADAAESLIGQYARNARGAGLTWGRLAHPLGLDDSDPATDLGIIAFERVADAPSHPFDRLTVRWRCDTCRQYVTDTGPYSNHPDDCETGHAPDCARHQAAIAAAESAGR